MYIYIYICIYRVFFCCLVHARVFTCHLLLSPLDVLFVLTFRFNTLGLLLFPAALPRYGLTSCLMGKNKAADLEKLQALQATLRKKAEAEAADAAHMPPPPPPAKKARKGKKVEPSESPKEPETKSAEDPAASAPAASSKKRTRSTGAEAEGAPKAKAKAKAKSSKGLKEPDFEISWENHGRLMTHFGITEDEATACLLAVVGEDESGKKFWSKFSKKEPEETAVTPAPESEPVTPKDTTVFTAPQQSRAERKAERAARQEMEDSQFQSTEEDSDDVNDGPVDDVGPDGFDDADEDTEECSVVSGGGRPDSPSPPGASQVPAEASVAIDTMDTLPMEEPVITPVASKPDAGEEARADLAKKLNSLPTPAKSSRKDQARHVQS